MYSQLPVGRLADRLERLTRKQVSLSILLTMTAVATLDIALPGIGFAPLYLPVICTASWCLGARIGYLAAASAAILSTILMPHLVSGQETLLIAKFAIRLFAFAFITSIILSARRSYERERLLARHDRMTGALNQESFREQLPRSLSIASSARQVSLLALLDFDNFKTLNNKHGHAAGDAILRRFAQEARSVLREQDHFGRLGGDEFAVLAFLNSAKEAELFAETLHARLSSVLKDGPLPVTCSMGALIIPPGNLDPPATLLHQTDMLMYSAKHHGKDGLHVGWRNAERTSTAGVDPRPGWQPVSVPTAIRTGNSAEAG